MGIKRGNDCTFAYHKILTNILFKRKTMIFEKMKNEQTKL